MRAPTPPLPPLTAPTHPPTTHAPIPQACLFFIKKSLILPQAILAVTTSLGPRRRHRMHPCPVLVVQLYHATGGEFSAQGLCGLASELLGRSTQRTQRGAGQPGEKGGGGGGGRGGGS